MTQDEIKDFKRQLEYLPETGDFVWKVTKSSYAGTVSCGATAGTEKEGYVRIGCNRKHYRAHRLAWLFMTGSFPEKGFEIDHINGIRKDNRWANLRLVTRAQNKMNSKKYVSNVSGKPGVSFRKTSKKWHARIVVGGKVILLGDFNEMAEAVIARSLAEERYFGEFRRI